MGNIENIANALGATVTMSTKRYEELITKEIKYDMLRKKAEGEYLTDFEKAIYDLPSKEEVAE